MHWTALLQLCGLQRVPAPTVCSCPPPGLVKSAYPVSNKHLPVDYKHFLLFNLLFLGEEGNVKPHAQYSSEGLALTYRIVQI